MLNKAAKSSKLSIVLSLITRFGNLLYKLSASDKEKKPVAAIFRISYFSSGV